MCFPKAATFTADDKRRQQRLRIWGGDKRGVRKSKFAVLDFRIKTRGSPCPYNLPYCLRKNKLDSQS